MRIKYNNKTYNLPDFLIVGAAKSGTTSMHYYLKQNSNIALPEIKESYFFSFYRSQPNFVSPDPLYDVISDIDEYANQFVDLQNNVLIGDASPSYLYSYRTTIANIKEIYGDKYKDLKIIIILRNPIDRAWSQYMHFKKNYNENLPFNKAITEKIIQERLEGNWNYFYDYIGFGKYTQQIKAYMENFKFVKVFLYDDLKKNSNIVINQTLEFLQVNFNKEQKSSAQNQIFNISGEPKKNIYSFFWRLKKMKIFKNVVRNVLSANIRNKLNNFLMAKSLNRVQIKKEDSDVLRKVYNKELISLYNLLKREEIKEW